MREDTLLIEVHVLEERLVIDVPCCRNVPGGEPAALLGLTHEVRTLIADGAVQDVAAQQRVVGVSKVSHVAAMGVADAVVSTVLFLHLLEELVVQ